MTITMIKSNRLTIAMTFITGQTTEDNRVHALLYFISPTGHGLRLEGLMLVLMLANIGDWFSCQGVRLQQAGVDAGKYMGLAFPGSYDSTDVSLDFVCSLNLRKRSHQMMQLSVLINSSQ